MCDVTETCGSHLDHTGQNLKHQGRTSCVMQGTARAAAYRCAAWLLDVMLQGHRQSVHVLVAETLNVMDL